MKKNSASKKAFMIFVVALLAFFAIGIILSVNNKLPSLSTTSSSTQVKNLVPHMASYKCDVVGSGTPSYPLPASGFWLSNDMGIYTDRITDIKIDVSKSFWDYILTQILGGGVRLRYQICNADKGNCQEYTDSVAFWGQIDPQHIPSAVDLRTNSIFFILEYKATLISSWKGVDSKNSQVSFSFNKFGLRLYSTTQDPAGKIICESGCDLTCPTQEYRSKLLYTTENVLNFYATAPYLEYWDEPANVGEQLGGTYYIKSKGEFCFGGYIYKQGTLKMDDGITYTYPQTYDRKEECCPGAVISTFQENKKCSDNYKWVEYSPNKCNSDVQCPGLGQGTCQYSNGQYIFSGWKCVSGTCTNTGTQQVECCSPDLGCPSDQVCQNNKCVAGTVVPPLEGCINDSDCITEEGGKCVQGYCRYPETKEECPPIWGFIPNVVCKIKNSIHRILTAVKFFLILLAFLLSLFYSKSFLSNNFRDVEERPWLGWTLSLVISAGIAYILYLFIGSFLFWIILLGVLVYNFFFSKLTFFNSVRRIVSRR